MGLQKRHGRAVDQPVRSLLSLFLAVTVHAAEITGKVVSVADGDTITVLTAAKESVKVRLHGIDGRNQNRRSAIERSRSCREWSSAEL